MHKTLRFYILLSNKLEINMLSEYEKGLIEHCWSLQIFASRIECWSNNRCTVINNVDSEEIEEIKDKYYYKIDD